MKINRDNYEQYFLDHAEAALSPEMERELELFLEANPDLRKSLEDFDASPLPVENVRNESLKKRLKKNIHPSFHINETNVDEWLIREMEGLLAEAESIELKVFLELNPAFEFDRKMFGLTRQQPDLSVNFPAKKGLKKRAPVLALTRIAWTLSAAAAVILIILGIRFLNRQPSPRELPREIQAMTEQIKEIKEEKPVKPEKGLESPGLESLAAVPMRTEPFRMTASRGISIVDHQAEAPVAQNLVIQELPLLVIAPEKKEEPILAKAFGKLVVKAHDAFTKNPNVENLRNANVDFWSIAEAGVKGFSTVTDRDLELKVRRDAEGNMKSYALVDEDRLLVTKSRDKN